MSNRKKPKMSSEWPRPPSGNGTRLSVPKEEKVVVKKVPAVIHWNQLDSTRTDSETIGEAIIYEDGTQDVIVFADISEEAKKLFSSFQWSMFSLGEED